ncbi:MAG: YicC family protein [Gammaproteobacteria bacterium]|nr:YicC family protein [Gammaproteobacteria bacterium]MYB37293.1 YicC family protein [Gammaproteobacteria bacterium]
MIASMTAFARVGRGFLVWEVRSVNHRYLELVFRLPESLRALEPSLREAARARLGRGKVDATLRVAESGSAMELDEDALGELLGALSQLRSRAPELAEPNLLDALRWPGVLKESETGLAELRRDAIGTFDEALTELAARRTAEGAQIQALIERLDIAAETTAKVRELASQQVQAMRDRLARAAEALTVSVNAERLEQELALQLQKADVAEELDRLDLHLAEARAALASDGPCGRRLDFLMQELGREANTLGAKAVLPEAAHAAVDLKVAIEQMREQVQNVE